MDCQEIRWASDWEEGPDEGLVAYNDPVSGPAFYDTQRLRPVGAQAYTHEVRRLAPGIGWTTVASYQTGDHVGRIVVNDGTLRFVTWGEEAGWLSVHGGFRNPRDLLWKAQITGDSVRDVVSVHDGGIAFITQSLRGGFVPGIGTVDAAGGVVQDEQPIDVPNPNAIRYRDLVPGHDGQAFVVVGDDSGAAYMGDVGDALVRYDNVNCELDLSSINHLRTGELAYVERCGDAAFLNLRTPDSESRTELPWVPVAAGEGPGGALVFGVHDESALTLVTFDPSRRREIARAPLPSLNRIDSGPWVLTDVSLDNAGPFVAVRVFSQSSYSTRWAIAEVCQPL